jgi:hypothetical protein
MQFDQDGTVRVSGISNLVSVAILQGKLDRRVFCSRNQQAYRDRDQVLYAALMWSLHEVMNPERAPTQNKYMNTCESQLSFALQSVARARFCSATYPIPILCGAFSFRQAFS